MKTEDNTPDKKFKIDPDASVERWTIDRLDRDAGIARLEKVPLAGQYKQEFISLINKAEEITAERLEWWDSKQTTVAYISITELKDTLMLENDETLNENMVFWILKTNSESRIIHATNQARNLAGELYRKVLGIEEGETRNDKK